MMRCIVDRLFCFVLFCFAFRVGYCGPSGLNRDYLWGLEAALDELSPESGDKHVSDLSHRVRTVAAREEGRVTVVSPEQVLQAEQQHHEQHHDFRKVSSVDEQEETEKTS
jgi:hypothetical protein